MEDQLEHALQERDVACDERDDALVALSHEREERERAELLLEDAVTEEHAAIERAQRESRHRTYG
eukprot:7376730-Prymnesium_polylepis.1